MQEITFAEGNELHLKDCRDAICRSTLGERYDDCIQDALAEGYVATSANGWHAVKVGSHVGWVSGEYSEIKTESCSRPAVRFIRAGLRACLLILKVILIFMCRCGKDFVPDQGRHP